MRSFNLTQFSSTQEIQNELDLICNAYARLFVDRILDQAHPDRNLASSARRIGFGLTARASGDSRDGIWVGYEIPAWEVTPEEMDFSVALLEDLQQNHGRDAGFDYSYPSREEIDLILDESERFIESVVEPAISASMSPWWTRRS